MWLTLYFSWTVQLDHMKDNYKAGNNQLFPKSIVDRIKANEFNMQREFEYMKKV